MKHFFTLVIPIFLSIVKCIDGISQTVEGDRQLSSINILSPNAASLGKYIDYPVNLHTGIPEITLPIYTINEGSLTLPISISYNASGIKVSEIASWVGLGWSLNANGVISRTVRGLPDEKAYAEGPDGTGVGFYHNHGYSSYLLNASGTLDYMNFGQGYKDGEPDIFFFNFNGYSGKFVFGEDNVPVIIPHQNIKIEPIFCQQGEGCNNNEQKLRSWKVTTPDGVKYYFGMSLDQATHGAPAVEQVVPITDVIGQSLSRLVSSWFLYKIESPDGRSVINFKYASERYSYYTLSMGRELFSYLDATEDKILVQNSVNGIRLESISFSQGMVSFGVETEPRQDLAGPSTLLDQTVNNEAKALKTIEIKNGTDYCKAFNFEYEYFIAKPGNLGGVLADYDRRFTMVYADKKRLKLKSVQERSCSGKVSVPKTEFDYFEDVPLPSTLSLGVDHWGYYNDKESNEWLIPQLSTDGGITYSIEGADREANPSVMKVATLRTIYHPLGGYTRFDYVHDNVTVRPTGDVGVTRYIGGNRIDRITNYDSKGNVITQKNFEYPSGAILFSVPRYIALMRNPEITIGDHAGGSDNGCISGAKNTPPYDFVFSVASVHPVSSTLGSHKGYETVLVRELDGSYSSHTYDISQAPDISRDVSVRVINIQQCDGSEPIYPSVPENPPLHRGVLLLEQYFDSSHPLPIKEIAYDYEFKTDEVGVHGMRVGSGGAFGLYHPSQQYQVKSGYKVKETRIEKTLSKENEAVQEVKTVTLFSKYLFNKPVSAVLYETSFGQSQPVKERRNSYVKDFSPCKQDVSERGTGYLGMVDDKYLLYQQNLDKCKTQAGRESICNDLEGCGGGRLESPCQSEYECRFCAYTEYQIEVNKARLLYINGIVGARESDCLTGLQPVSDQSYQTILELNKQNFVALDVESTEWRYGKLVKSSIVNYSPNPTHISVDNLQQIDLGSPVLPADFDSAQVDGNAFLKDNAYNPEPEVRYRYDNARIVEIQNKTSPVVSYIWDLVNDNVIVKGENITYQDLRTAYETALTYGVVGTLAFNTQLRNLAASAMITTYTHKNLVGITSSTDSNNITSYYEYDDLGRVKIVKDDQGNILKYYDYQYNLKR